jgi:CDGSH-type Zn-finger protein
VEPRLVAEIAYTERTSDDVLRHPSFVGLREDKRANEVRARPALARETDGGPAEPVPTDNTVTVVAEGPLYLRGDIELLDADGVVIGRDTRVALCRCGASANKPYCDNSHLRLGFDDAGALADGSAVEAPAPGPGTVRVTVAVDGPLLVEGPVELRGSNASGVPVTQPISLCRCGASARKPLCDGSHRRIGFHAG